MLPWFRGLHLFCDQEGFVCYNMLCRTFLLHEQVYIICVKRGSKEMPQPAINWRLFVRQKADPRVRAYYESGRRQRTPEATAAEEEKFVAWDLKDGNCFFAS